MKKLLILSSLVSLCLIGGCNKKEESKPSSTTGGETDLVTSAELVGSYNACRSGGTTFASVPLADLPSGPNSSYLETLTFSGTQNYTYSQYWFSGSVCQLGGNSYFVYTQDGTYALNGAATVAGATNIVYTVVSSTFSTFGTSAPYFPNRFNGSCFPANTFNPAATSTSNSTPQGRSCMGIVSHNWNLGTFPNLNTTANNVLKLDGNDLTMGNLTQWYPGTTGSYPTTATRVLRK